MCVRVCACVCVCVCVCVCECLCVHACLPDYKCLQFDVRRWLLWNAALLPNRLLYTHSQTGLSHTHVHRDTVCVVVEGETRASQ